MKLYSMCTPSHSLLKDKAFLPSIKDDFEVVIREFPQECISGDYKSTGWVTTIKRKVGLILEALNSNRGDAFVWADIDIQFFRPMQQELFRSIGENDFLIMKDSPDGKMCTGFFMSRANRKTRLLWLCIRDILEQEGNERDEQDIANDLLLNGWAEGRMTALRLYLAKLNSKAPRSTLNIFRQCCRIIFSPSWDLKWAVLPETYFGGGTLTGTPWQPGSELPVPENIILHHANWTIGVHNKLAQMEYVRARLEESRKSLNT